MTLANVLSSHKLTQQKTFVAYITAGDRSLSDTYQYILALCEAGVDIIELGVPHSDPVADGPTNQKAATRSLERAYSLSEILEHVRQWRAKGLTIPLVLFTYYNPVLRMGLEAFALAAKSAGIDGVLVVDLPPEESHDLVPAAQRHGLDTIFLASPTTEKSRLALINASSTGFVYYVSRLGVTGAKSEISSTLGAELKMVREQVQKPILVGFGISTPDQAREAASFADGVIVGSAFVKIIENERDPHHASQKIRQLAKTLVRATKHKEISTC